MTWYAQQVIADAVPGLLAELRAHPVFARGLYHVQDLADRRRVDNEVVAVMLGPEGPEEMTAPIERGPRLPAAGLLFVRELCDLADENESMREWFGDDAIAWGPMPVATAASLPALAIERAHVTSRLVSPDAAPPERLLQELARLAHAHAATITWYSTYFWGGEQEHALAYVFDPAARLEVAYTYVGENELIAPSGDHRSIWRVDPYGARQIIQGDVLSLALLHHGLAIQRHFVPHESAFPWQQHRLAPAHSSSD